jgi:hypothetical protein
MNPRQPPDDESQLDRIERKLDRLDGSYLATLLVLAVLLTAAIFVLVEIVSAG